jgi:3-hydroxybutyryl-CoA dehydrogenase
MRVAIIGCGTMGHGIAQVSAQAGCDVLLVGRAQDSLDTALERIAGGLGRLGAKGALDEPPEAILARIEGTVDLDRAGDRDLIVETVPEDLATKLAVWRALAGRLGETTVCATNTSSLSVIEQAMATGRPDCMIGLHFFVPPQRMRLIELVRSVASSDRAVAVGRAYGERIGRDVVIAPDRAGFIVNRLLLPYVMDAIRAWESGVGSIADIDLAMQSGTGYPMGPFTLLDYVGLDVALTMTEQMYAEYRETRFSAPPTLRKLVAAGFLGRQSGRGFYDYAATPAIPMDAAAAAVRA